MKGEEMKYYEGIREMRKEKKFNIRLKMVKLAMREGISESARVYETTRVTVRKWMKRYKEEGLRGLEDKRRVPGRIPHRISKEEEEKIVKLRKELPKWGQDRLKSEFELPYSTKTINRVLNQYGLIRRRKKKWQKRRDLREMKKKMKPFEKIQLDVKELTDIEKYFPQWLEFKLPKYQYSARDIKTGGVFLAYSYVNDTTTASLFAAYLCHHLKRIGLNLPEVIFQTDNGSEFIGNVNKTKDTAPFVKVLSFFQVPYQRIPPASCTWNSDVEAFHRLCEHDFYEVESFFSLDNFLKKAYTYLLYFNYLRKNRWRDNQSPWEILEKANPAFPKGTFNLPPPILDHSLDSFRLLKNHQGGYLVGNAVKKILFFA
jgi:transposase